MKYTAPFLTVALAALAVLVFESSLLSVMLQFERESAWQAWRVLTGHLTHWSADHLLWDVGAFSVLGAFVESRGRRRLVATLLGSAVAIPLAVLVLDPGAATYRGLSGIDSALFVVALAIFARESRGRTVRIACAALALAFTAKVGYEALVGATVFVDSSGFRPLPLAHLVGAGVGGIVVARSVATRGATARSGPATAPRSGRNASRSS